MPPLCQIGISVFNQPCQWVQEAVNSALAQDMDDRIECVVRVDGPASCCSETENWLTNESKKNPRLKVIFGKVRLGTFGSYRQIFQHSDSKFICQLDADDWLESNMVSSCIKALESNPYSPFICTDYRVHDINSGRVREISRRSNYSYNELKELVEFTTFHGRIIRRNYYELAGGYSPYLKYSGDYDLCLKLAELGKPSFLSEFGYNYRTHVGNTSRLFRKALFDEAFSVCQAALIRRKEDYLYLLTKDEREDPKIHLNLSRGPILIAGMHKSGTSLCALIMQCLGLEIGEKLLRADEFNPKGYAEDIPLVEINRSALIDQQWDPEWGFYNPNMTNVPSKYHNSWTSTAKNYLQTRYSQTNYWGWKDPRNSLLLDKWMSIAPSMRVACVYRSPLGALISLRKTNYSDVAKNAINAVKIWLNFNRHLLDFYSKHPERMIIVNSVYLKNNPHCLIKVLKSKWLWQLNSDHNQLNQNISNIVRNDLLNDPDDFPLENLVPKSLAYEAMNVYSQLESLADVSSVGLSEDFDL